MVDKYENKLRDERMSNGCKLEIKLYDQERNDKDV